MTTKKVEIKPECMVCGNNAKYKIGLDRVPLCGIHKNQIKRDLGFGFFGETMHLTRPQIRAAFGFLVVNDSIEKK